MTVKSYTEMFCTSSAPPPKLHCKCPFRTTGASPPALHHYQIFPLRMVHFYSHDYSLSSQDTRLHHNPFAPRELETAQWEPPLKYDTFSYSFPTTLYCNMISLSMLHSKCSLQDFIRTTTKTAQHVTPSGLYELHLQDYNSSPYNTAPLSDRE